MTREESPAVDAAVLLRLDREVGGSGRSSTCTCARCRGAAARSPRPSPPTIPALRRAARTLRSASAFVGASSLTTLCERLEAASEQTAPLPVNVGTEVAAESRRVELELRALLAAHPFG